jgi:hypothetical protein
MKRNMLFTWGVLCTLGVSVQAQNCAYSTPDSTILFSTKCSFRQVQAPFRTVEMPSSGGRNWMAHFASNSLGCGISVYRLRPNLNISGTDTVAALRKWLNRQVNSMSYCVQWTDTTLRTRIGGHAAYQFSLQLGSDATCTDVYRTTLFAVPDGEHLWVMGTGTSRTPAPEVADALQALLRSFQFHIALP